MDDSKAVSKKFISEDISSNYNVDDDDINVTVNEFLRALKSAKVTAVTLINVVLLLHRKEKYFCTHISLVIFPWESITYANMKI